MEREGLRVVYEVGNVVISWCLTSRLYFLCMIKSAVNKGCMLGKLYAGA